MEMLGGTGALCGVSTTGIRTGEYMMSLFSKVSMGHEDWGLQGLGKPRQRTEESFFPPQDPSSLQRLQMDPPALSYCALWSLPDVWTL